MLDRIGRRRLTIVSHFAMPTNSTRLRRALLHERYSYECYMTDQIEQAIEARHEALEIRRSAQQPLEAGDNLRWLSRLSWFSGRGARCV